MLTSKVMYVIIFMCSVDILIYEKRGCKTRKDIKLGQGCTVWNIDYKFIKVCNT